jgi:hypothetical protein
MNKIIHSALATVIAAGTVVVLAAGCGPATITTPDGWILPDTGTVTRCVNDGDITLCTDTVTGQRYRNGVPISS